MMNGIPRQWIQGTATHAGIACRVDSCTRSAAAQNCLIPQLSYRSYAFWTQFNTIYPPIGKKIFNHTCLYKPWPMSSAIYYNILVYM
jgi:hypothetical protein